MHRMSLATRIFSTFWGESRMYHIKAGKFDKDFHLTIWQFWAPTPSQPLVRILLCDSKIVPPSLDCLLPVLHTCRELWSTRSHLREWVGLSCSRSWRKTSKGWTSLTILSFRPLWNRFVCLQLCLHGDIFTRKRKLLFVDAPFICTKTVKALALSFSFWRCCWKWKLLKSIMRKRQLSVCKCQKLESVL